MNERAISNVRMFSIGGAFAALFFIAKMTLAGAAPLSVEMRASHDALAIFSQLAGDAGLVMLVLAAIMGVFFKGVKPLFPGIAGLALIGFSYFGALPLANAMGPDTFVKSVVAEASCFPEEYLSIINSYAITPPSPEQVCN